MNNKEIDQALCALNQEYLDLKNSREYQLGLKLSKLIWAVKNRNFQAFRSALEHRGMVKKLEGSKKQNDVILPFDASIRSKTKIAVYTCITGNYDQPLEPLFTSDEIEYFIVTDMTISNNSAWKKIDINSVPEVRELDNTRKARYVKTHPHVFFPEYEYSIWVDSNFRVVGDLSKYIGCTCNEVPFASNWHPERNSIFTELDACISRKKDDPELLTRQVESYRKEGMPEDFGLIESNLIVRKHNDEKCIRLMEAWFAEISKWSRRDQLSLPYVVWKQGYTMHSLGYTCDDIRNNPTVQVVLHSSKYVCPT